MHSKLLLLSALLLTPMALAADGCGSTNSNTKGDGGQDATSGQQDGGNGSSSGGSSGSSGSSSGTSPYDSSSGGSSGGTSMDAGGDTSVASDGGHEGGLPDSDASQCRSRELGPGVCNDIVATGPIVTDQCSSSEPPQAQGGPVEDGLYVLQSAVTYGPCSPTSTQTTWTICGPHWDVGQTSFTFSGNPDAGSSHIQVNYTATIQGSSVALTPTCQSPGLTLSSMTEVTATRQAG